MKKILPIIAVLIAAVAVGAFYAGMKYGNSRNSLSNLSRQDLSSEQRQQIFQANMSGGSQRGSGANFLSGEVISKDDKSLTIEMPEGGSKIVFFSGSTKILKTTDGSIDDIGLGKQITISGKENSDGSYTAESIQERQLIQR